MTAGLSLRGDILDALQDRAEARVLTVRNRGRDDAHFNGAQLLAAAEHRLELWQEAFGPGPKVLIAALPAGEEFLISLIATLIGEGTLVPVALPRVTDTADRLHRIATTCGATAVLCLSRNRKAIEAQLCGACPVLAVDQPVQPVSDRAGVRAPLPFPIIQHTSGSTRFPKAVPIGAAQIRANCQIIRSLWGMGPQSTMVNWLPHYHDMGLMGCILYPLLCGAGSVQMSPFEMIRSPLSWLATVSEFRATISGGPAFAFNECLSRITPEESASLDLSAWESAFCGAEPVPSGLLDRFAARFAVNGLKRRAVFACYGMAECTLFAAGEPPPAGGANPAPTAATRWPEVEGCLLSDHTRSGVMIADPATRSPLPDGVEGEIWLAGESLVPRYLDEPEETQQAFVSDVAGRRWFRTGDLGGIDGGRLFITGRSKDIVIVNGRNVAAAEIEWIAARQHEGLNPSAAAVFVPEGSEGGHAVLVIELRLGAAALTDPDALVTRIRRAVLSACGVALDEVRFVRRGTLPRTTSGKIRRRQVRQEYARDAARACEAPVA